jgi:2-polyprenyl-3-methyl-5-hydroxy-6-metoxy-1,4-benzoquinol methylase
VTHGRNLVPTRPELEQLFRQKHGAPEETGWAPRRRLQFGYFPPADVYEAVVDKLVVTGSTWIDVGGGHNIFPENPQLARSLSARCSEVVAVDPSENVHRNSFATERVQSSIEDYSSKRSFDIATLRMVAEHIQNPDAVTRALSRLIRPGGVVVVLTVNRWAPLTLLSRLTPFSLHHPIKRIFWGSEEEDTFPVQYRMNSRSQLKATFSRAGFREVQFAYLDDLSTWARFRTMNYVEMVLWRAARRLRCPYPENCILGIYEKAEP